MSSLSKDAQLKSSQMGLQNFSEPRFGGVSYSRSVENYERKEDGDDLFEDERGKENEDFIDFEQISLDSKISSNNVGYKLLQKMGWKGKGLGKSEQGIIEPIRAGIRDAKLGVGKQEEYDYYTAEENIKRKKLDVEIEETEEMAKKREEEAEREDRIKKEVKEIQKVFFCELCNKQYKFVKEFENHLSSYDHNHKKRFKDMKSSQMKDKREERLKKERMKEEKELMRLANLANARRREQERNKVGSEREDDIAEKERKDTEVSVSEAATVEQNQNIVNNSVSEKNMEVEVNIISEREKEKERVRVDTEKGKGETDVIASEDASVTNLDPISAVSEKRTTLKFGFLGKGASQKKGGNQSQKKKNTKEKTLSIFQNESDEEN